MTEQKENNNDKNCKKILMICGDYGEDYEIMVPFQTLSTAGYRVDVVCPGKKKGDKIITSIHDFEGAQTYSEKRGHLFELTYSWNDAVKNKLEYIGLFIPGGRAPEYLSTRKDVIDLVTYFTDENLPIGTICHGPLILAAIPNYLNNKKATCYPACSPILKSVNCNYQKAEPITTSFVDNNLVTAAAWPAHPKLMSSFMNILGCKINNTKNKSILIIAGDYVEDYEIMCVYQILLSFGYSVDVICPKKKKGEKIFTAVHDFEGAQTYSEKRGHFFELNATFDIVIKDLSKYSALYIPGGRSPEYLSINDDVLKAVKYFYNNNKIISHVCHGILVLAAAGILKGHSCTAYPACKPFVDLAGGKWLKPDPIDSAFIDKHNDKIIVSAAAWPGHINLMQKLMEVLGAEIKI